MTTPAPAHAARSGFIGLGTMGRRMAERLLAMGHPLLVYDRVERAIAQVTEPTRGGGAAATGAGSADEVITACDVVFTSLPAPDDLVGLYLRHGEASPAIGSGKILVDLSTIDPTTSRRIATAVAARGASFLDAPVSGGHRGAEAGTLTVMVGGERSALERVRPLLAAFAERVLYVGPSGSGAAVKLANQLLVAANTAAAMEAIVFAGRFGVGPAQLLDVLGSSAGDSRMLRRSVNDFALPRDFSPAFLLRLLVKDLRLYTAEAQAAGVAVPSGGAMLDAYEAALAAGLGDEDYAAILKLLEGAAPT